MPTQSIQYNGHSFTFNRLGVSERPVMASDGITQQLTEFTFNVSGHIVADTPALLKAQLDCMRARLTVPHKSFIVQWTPEGDSASTFFSFDNTGNADWGPIPGELSINGFAGGRAAIYTWSVSVGAKDCANGCTINQTGGADRILSITRQWSFSIDPNGFTTRTVSGKLVVSAVSVQGGRPADYFRWSAAPSLPTNYKRESQNFTQSEDGRELSFTITDAEQMWTLPSPISNGKATFTSHSAEMGFSVEYTLSGRFEAPATVSRTTILQCIFNLIAAKFPLNQAAFIFQERRFTDDVYGNAIDFSITATSTIGSLSGTHDGPPDFSAALNPITVTPPNSTGVSQAIGAYGADGTASSGVTGQAPIIYDACSPQNNTNTSTIPTGSTGGGSGGGGTGSVPPTPGTPGTYQSTGTSTDHLTNPFHSVHEVISYETDNHLVVFSPKVIGQAPKIFQTAAPTLTVVFAGYYKQYAKRSIDVRKPPGAPLGDGKVIRSYISAATPEPVGDGSWNLYTVEFRHIYAYTQAIATANLSGLAQPPHFPEDPRRPAGEETKMPQLPDVAIIN